MTKLKSLLFGVLIVALFATTARSSAQTVLVGQHVTISLTADGTTPFAYQWFKVTSGTPALIGTDATYVINSAVAGDEATYYVVVSNSAGSATSDNAILTVNWIPIFTSQQADVAVAIGSSINLVMAVSAKPVATYQWQKNGVNIVNATSLTYSIQSAVASDAGTYTLIATNSAGSATSRNVIVSVNVAPPTNVKVKITVP